MAEERYTFAQARARLEEIVVQVRKKDTSLEKSLDLLEEGVRLANTCTELSDHTEWRTAASDSEPSESGDESGVDVEKGEDAGAMEAPFADRANDEPEDGADEDVSEGDVGADDGVSEADDADSSDEDENDPGTSA